MLDRVGTWFRQLPQAARWGTGLIVIVVALNVLGSALDAIYGGGSPGPSSSSFTTDASGTAAYAELLRRAGREIVQSRDELASSELDPSATLLVLSPSQVGENDVRAMVRFAEDGGRLVIAVEDSPAWLDEIVPGAPTWTEQGEAASNALVPTEETNGVGSVASLGLGSWRDAGDTLPVLGGERVSATVADLGEGRLVMLADASILQNRFLDRNDNAAFALAIVGDDRRVVFAESFHGYEQEAGFDALPERAPTTLMLLLVGVLLAMVAYGRRFGPPDRTGRDLPPPRRAYVDALAATLAKARDRDAAIEPLRARARTALGRNLKVAAGASREEWLEAARERGLSDQVEALLQPVRDDEEAVRVGRVALQIMRGKR